MRGRYARAGFDQIITSVRPAAFLLITSNLSSVDEFAKLAIAFTLIQLVTGIYAAGVIEPWLINVSRGNNESPAFLFPVCTSVSALVLVIAVRDPLLLSLWPILPLSQIFEARRAAAYVADRHAEIVWLSTVPLAGLVIGSVTLGNSYGVTLGLATGMLLGAYGWQPRKGRRARGKLWSWSPLFAVDYLASTGYGLSVVLFLSYYLSPVDASGLRLSQQLFAVATIAFTGLKYVLLPSGGALALMRRTYVRSVLIMASLGTVSACVAWLFLWLWGSTIDREIRTVVYMVSPGLALQSILLASYTLTPLLLKRLDAGRRLVVVRAITLLASFIAVLSGAWLGGVEGAAWGLAAGSIAGAIAWHTVIRSVLK